jgi:hypothetical protein
VKRFQLLAAAVVAMAVVSAAGQAAWAAEANPALEGAHRFSRPNAEEGPTRISVAVWVANVDKIDSVAQTFSAHMFLAARWHDPRLAHPESQGIIQLPLDEIWRPPFAIANAAGFIRHTLPEVVEVDPEGNITYRQGFIGTFAQRLYLKDFPFDEQVFRVHGVVPGYSPAELELVPDERFVSAGMREAAGIAEEITLPDWKITGWTAGPRPYDAVPWVAIAGYAFEFEAERSSAHYILKVILPLLLIVMMSWTVFWIDPDLPLLLIVMMSWTVFWIDPENAGSQISVAVTSMLTLIAYRFAVGGEVPRIPYTTRLDTFILASTILVFFSLLQVMLTTRLARRDRVELARRIDHWSRALVPLAFAVVTVLSLIV